MAGNPARWGPLLQDSNMGSFGALPYRNVSTFQEIRLVAQQIAESPVSVTWSMLEDLLLATQFPTDLPTIDSSLLVSLCVKLIKAYTERNRLFDHLYGLRCVQVLALALQIDILKRRGLLARAAPHIAKFGPQTVEFWLADNAAREANKITIISPSIHFQFWDADLKHKDRHFLLLVLWQARKELFHVCGLVPGIQGWVVIFAVIWLPLVHEPTQMEALLYYRLKDVICRFSLAAKDDKTHPAAPTIVRWLHNELGARGYDNPKASICVDPADIEEMPVFRGVLTERLKRSGKNRMDANIAATAIEFFIGYHVRSSEVLLINTELRLLIEAAYERLWLEVEDRRCLRSLEYRDDAGDLVYAFLQTLSVLLLEPIASGREGGAHLTTNSITVANAFRNVDWIGLMGRVILMPTLPLNGRPLSVAEYAVVNREYDFLKEIGTHCQVLSSYDQEAFLALSTSFSGWRKTYDFIQLQYSNKQQHPTITKYFKQVKDLWNFLGQTFGFEQVAVYRCAYTGCSSSEVTHKINVKACGNCCRTFYCSRDCQAAHNRSESWNSHLWVCCLERPNALLCRS